MLDQSSLIVIRSGYRRDHFGGRKARRESELECAVVVTTFHSTSQVLFKYRRVCVWAIRLLNKSANLETDFSGKGTAVITADASILPHVTTGNTMAPCVVIGERAAEILKVAHGM